MKIFKKIVLLAFGLFLSFCIAELAYRLQWFDFYSTELNGLNSKAVLNSSDKNRVLVLGDSFSADTNSYVGKLQHRFPQFNFINAAVPGTGILETNCIAKNRIERFKPSLIIYQIYIGNDLFDIRKSLNGNISLSRKIFWWLTDRLLVLRYINYKAGQLKNTLGINPIHQQYRNDEIFSVQSFSSREKLLLRAEPLLIENSVLLKNGREMDAQVLVNGLRELNVIVKKENARLIVLLIPHCAQVNHAYLNKMEKVGAQFTDKTAIHSLSFPFCVLFKEKLKGEGVEIISPLESFQQIDTAGNLLYYQNDIHLNSRGQQVVTDLISSAIRKLKN